MSIEFTVSTVLPAAPYVLYAAWLDSEQHSAMTGGQAEVSAQVGDQFNAWDGYISGQNLQLEPEKRIVQAWRTVEFSESEPDSRVEIVFEPHEEGTRLTLHHTNLPPHGEQYQQGWIDNYFEPMRQYFEK